MERASLVRRARDAGLALSILAANTLALATPTDPFDTAVDNVTTKVEAYGAALVILAAVGVVFMIGIKYVKKIRGAA